MAKRLVALIPWCCAGFHAAGLAAMALLLRPGTLTEPVAAVRAEYITGHPATWTVGWTIWMASAVSLVAFYAWWGARLTARRAAACGVLLAAAGCACDLTGETLYILSLPQSAMHPDLSQFQSQERIATLLTAGAANTFYTLGGLVLMLWTPDLPKPVRLAMWGTWIAGGGMTLAAALSSVGGMVATTTVLFPLLIGWTIWMGRSWRRP